MDTRTRNSKRNIIVAGLGRIITPIFGFIIKSAIIRHLSVDYLGLTSLFGSVISILNLAELGFSSVVIVNLFKPIQDGDIITVRKLLSYYRRVYRVVGASILIFGISASPLIMKSIGNTGEIRENIYILYFLYIADAALNYLLFGYIEALINAAQRLDVTTVLFIIAYALKNGLQLIAISVFNNFYLFGLISVLGTLLYNIFLKIASGKIFRDYYPDGMIDTETRRTIRKQVMGLSIANLMGASRNSLDSIILTSFFSLALAGQYSNYYVIYNSVVGIIAIIVRSIRTSVGNSLVSEYTRKNLTDLYKMEFLLNLFITACTAYLISLYQPFMKIWMGEDLLFDDRIMVLFVLYYYVMAIAGVRNAYFAALGYWWKAKWINIAELILNIVLNIVLGRFFGVAGILIATIFTVFILDYFFINNILFRDYFGQGRRRFYTDRTVYTIITAMTCGISYYLCSHMLLYKGIGGLILKMAVCTVTIICVVPLMMFLFKRKDLYNSVAFIRQIIKA